MRSPLADWDDKHLSGIWEDRGKTLLEKQTGRKKLDEPQLGADSVSQTPSRFLKIMSVPLNPVLPAAGTA